jgi:hypothetical protein
MPKRQYDRELEKGWRQVLRRYATSKLTVREFCRREALSEPSFYAWRRTIAERDGETKPKPRSSSSPKRRPNGSPDFLPLVLDANDLQIDPPGIVIELRGQRRLRLPSTIEPARLAMLVHAIEAEPRT